MSAARSPALLLLLLLAPAPARAQLFAPEGEKDFQEGLRSLYNLDYELSRAHFRRLIESEPENPFSYLAESGAIWWQSSNEHGLFNDAPALESLFESDVKNALKKGEAALRAAEDKGDREGKAKAYFAVGMALGARGQWKLLRRRWLGAYFDGKHAVKRLNRCLKLDGEFFDAYTGLGFYDYQAGHLPRLLKLSALFFVHGDSRRGIERLQLAFERARYTPGYAAMSLATIYMLDQRDDAKALPLLRALRSRFPESPYFLALELMALARLKDPSALEAAKALAVQARNDPAFLGRKQLSLWCGLYGEGCLSPAAAQEARDWLSGAIEKEEGSKPSFRLALLHFYRGAALDLLGRRDQAVEDYEFVVTGPSFEPVNALARHCLENTCDRDEALRQLKAMSLEEVGAPRSLPPEPEINLEDAGRERSDTELERE